MRPDRVRDRLMKSNRKLTTAEATAKMVDMINIYHSIEYRSGSSNDKDEARQLIRSQVSELRKRVGTTLARECLWYLNDSDAWNEAKDGYLR